MLNLINELDDESSPYLQLYKDQSIAWKAWSESSLAFARTANKPIFLSIGYSASYWCQKMSSNCFDHRSVAILLNEHFVNIKVDREERPDLDQVYQLAHQLLNGNAGAWPLSAFLCPHTLLPFFVGSYFDLNTSGQAMPFDQLLIRINDYYHNQAKDKDKLLAQVEQSFNKLSEASVVTEADCQKSLWETALQRLMLQKDEQHGGFGHAPKFSMPVNLNFMMDSTVRKYISEVDFNYLHFTLKVMSERGMNDRIGGGFFRYSTDSQWRIPHFEKMLYDNGMLLEVYARAWFSNQNPIYKSAAFGIIRWLRQFMLSEFGVFYSALDSGINDRDGGFYLTNLVEIKSELEAEEFELFDLMFGLTEQSVSKEGKELFICFSQCKDLSASAKELMRTRDAVLVLYRSGRQKIENIRRGKILPDVDHKILTSSNALVIKGLAVMARVDDMHKELPLAQQAIDFILEKLWVNQRLFACWVHGNKKGYGLLDDHVYLIDALLEMLQTNWRDKDYQFVSALTETALEWFEDNDNGGFFYTPHDHEELIYRSKPFDDNILPSPNGVAAKVFLRLGILLAEPRYTEAAQRILMAGYSVMSQLPENHLTMVHAWEEYRQAIPIVMLLDDGSMDSWQTDIQANFTDQVMCFRVPSWEHIYPVEMLVLERGEGIVCCGDEVSEPFHSRIELIAELSGLLSSTK
jgi:uncharacterized protein YyaL (SSP411 family)